MGAKHQNISAKPQNLEEKLIYYTIVWTYGLYFLGAQFVWIPILAFFLTFRLCQKLWQQNRQTPLAERISIPVTVWVWIAAMLVMELALIMAHVDFNMGPTKIVFTTVNSWARTWWLMALFPLVGCLKIRPQVICRAACILCLQSLVFAILCYLLYLLHIPDISYFSPLKIFKGSASYYAVDMYVVGEGGTQFRLQLFTNFANTLGLVGCVYFWVASYEANKRWRWIGMVGAAAMVIGSGSRLTMLALGVVPIATWFLTNFSWPMQIAAGFISFFAGILAPQIIMFLEDLYFNTIKSYRSGSERVRSQLKLVALERWQEAPIWGHGIVAETGPKTTESMPIGSHEQWTDLLYVRGIVGFVAFLFAMLWTLSNLLIKAQKSPTAKTALGIYLVFLVATFGADIEAAAYAYWPGLVLAGIAFNEEVSQVSAASRKYVLP